MKLMTKAIEARFAKVGRQEKVADPIIIAKFFSPVGRATWYATEYDPKERRFLAMRACLEIITMSGAILASMS